MPDQTLEVSDLIGLGPEFFLSSTSDPNVQPGFRTYSAVILKW